MSTTKIALGLRPLSLLNLLCLLQDQRKKLNLPRQATVVMTRGSCLGQRGGTLLNNTVLCRYLKHQLTTRTPRYAKRHPSLSRPTS